MWLNWAVIVVPNSRLQFEETLKPPFEWKKATEDEVDQLLKVTESQKTIFNSKVNNL